ncbi:hypothetical protein RJT34_04182 [Clitoria ternatea]|uniref:Uncharacterized protein n=1 Tax=Clitoria ternatea TaxID=43366 RepID=A0AAN9Q1Z7_CLITE
MSASFVSLILFLEVYIWLGNKRTNAEIDSIALCHSNLLTKMIIILWLFWSIKGNWGPTLHPPWACAFVLSFKVHAGIYSKVPRKFPDVWQSVHKERRA